MGRDAQAHVLAELGLGFSGSQSHVRSATAQRCCALLGCVANLTVDK